MKQNLLIVLILGLLIAVLAALNAASYVQKEKVPDTEFDPNRSTYNPGSTGTQALYALLSETGRNVTRWRSSVETIASETKNRPSVFVMIGPLRGELTDAENTQLMKWVAAGGTLILIDREPSPELAKTTSQWQVSVAPMVSPELYNVDASDQRQMTASTAAHKPVQPSLFSNGVNAVQPSRFASSIGIERFKDEKSGTTYRARIGEPVPDQGSAPSPTPSDSYPGDKQPMTERDPHVPDADAGEATSDDEAPETKTDVLSLEAPLVHITDSGRNLLIEAPFEQGRVIILSDPYIVSNAGINLVDNARLAVNLVTSRDGLIAFDEYHHGYGANNNRFFQYFDGTPVIAIFLQCGLLVALIFFSQSRRFARPVPEKDQSRLSKLEYVSAMAELQQRTKAYDLAIENIYADFRRRVCIHLGLDNTIATRDEIAKRIAERTDASSAEIESLLFECEDVIHGEPVGRRDALHLVERIRKLEEKLGLQRSVRNGA